MNFVNQLITDEKSWKTMKQKIHDTREQRHKQTMAMQQAKSLNPALREIEAIFNPIDNPIVKQESEENELEQLREGLFIQRNYNIVPHYREYLQQKSSIISCVQRTKNRRVLKKREQLIEEKKAYAEFYLNRWAIYRKVENQRLD